MSQQPSGQPPFRPPPWQQQPLPDKPSYPPQYAPPSMPPGYVAPQYQLPSPGQQTQSLQSQYSQPRLQQYQPSQPPQPYYPQTQVIITQQKSPNLFLRFLWFVCIGSWLSALWMVVAWLFIVLIITMPLGLMMVNKLPFLASLKHASSDYRVAVQGAITRIQQVEKQQVTMILRVLYFLFVGWWLSGIWMVLAWLLGLTIIGLPLTIMMYDRVPAVTTLRRY